MEKKPAQVSQHFFFKKSTHKVSSSHGQEEEKQTLEYVLLVSVKNYPLKMDYASVGHTNKRDSLLCVNCTSYVSVQYTRHVWTDGQKDTTRAHTHAELPFNMVQDKTST